MNTNIKLNILFCVDNSDPAHVEKLRKHVEDLMDSACGSDHEFDYAAAYEEMTDEELEKSLE